MSAKKRKANRKYAIERNQVIVVRAGKQIAGPPRPKPA